MNDEKLVFTRRDFIKNSVGAAAVLGLSGRLNAQSTPSGKLSNVVLVRNESVFDAENNVKPDILKQMLNETVTAVTGKNNAKEAWQSLFNPADVVGLVPTKALNPTCAELYEAVQTALVDAGIPQENIINAQGRDISNVKSCTALINMPGLKAHWLTGIGTVLKNYILFSGSPRDYHEADSMKLGEIWNLDYVKGKTRLQLVDAITGLCDKGPQVDPQYKWPYRGLIAGTDPVAVETICLKIIMAKRELMKGEPWPLSPPPICIEAADKTYKLGTSEMAKIDLKKIGWMEGVLV